MRLCDWCSECVWYDENDGNTPHKVTLNLVDNRCVRCISVPTHTRRRSKLCRVFDEHTHTDTVNSIHPTDSACGEFSTIGHMVHISRYTFLCGYDISQEIGKNVDHICLYWPTQCVLTKTQ